MLSDSSSVLVIGDTPGDAYYIIEANSNGCTDLDTVMVTTAADVFVDAGPDINLYSNQSGTIGGSPTTYPTNDYSWSPPIFLNATDLTNPTVIDPQVSTWYYVIVTDTNGCTNIDSIFVTVLPNIVISDGISPGSDGKNDTWILDFIGQYPSV